MKTIDPEMKLEGFRLQDALEAMYNQFSAVLLGRRCVADGPDLYLRAIPQMVFEAAIGAGWFPLAEEHFDPKVGTSKGDVIWEADFHFTDKMDLPQWILDHIERAKKEESYTPPHKTTFTKNQAKRIVEFGEFYVDRTYLGSFYDLLREVISFGLADGTLHEERLKSLPEITSTDQREALLQTYIGQEKAKGNEIEMAEIARRSGVDYSILVKWRKGPRLAKESSQRIADSSMPGQRILLLLLFDEWNKPRAYRRAITK